MKPICFFDLETTGTVVGQDRIVEIAIVKMGVEMKELGSFHQLINPEIPIPPRASEVHGITDDHVKDKPTLQELATEIKAFIEGYDLAGYNSNAFDIPLLYSEMNRVKHPLNLNGTRFYDAAVIFKRMEERTLSAAVKFFLDREHEGAHGALSDTRATVEVMKAMFDRYEALKGMSREELELFCSYDQPRADVQGKFTIDEDGDYVFTFSKHKGSKAKTEPGFLEWMLRNDFLPDTKDICRKLLGI